MNINDMKTSRFISKTDLPAPPNGLIVTIRAIGQENVAMPDAQPEMKFTLMIKELPKPFVLNITNANAIGAIVGSEETDDWVGKQVEMYYDPTISMAGKIVGGIRMRVPNPQQSITADAAIDNAFDDDIPL